MCKRMLSRTRETGDSPRLLKLPFTLCNISPAMPQSERFAQKRGGATGPRGCGPRDPAVMGELANPIGHQSDNPGI